MTVVSWLFERQSSAWFVVVAAVVVVVVANAVEVIWQRIE